MPRSVLPAAVFLALLTSATVVAEVPLGGEFQVNTFTTGEQTVSIVAADAAGNFLVVWISSGQDGSDWGMFGRRYDAAGTPLGSAEFRVNSHTTGPQTSPAAAFDGTGRVVVVWESQVLDGSHNGIFARRYDTAGAAGSEFRVSPVTTSLAQQPSVGADAAGNFVVAYQRQTGASLDVFAGRFDVSGVAQGAEIPLNSHTTSAQSRPKVAVAPDGHFVAVWQSFQTGQYDVFARVFDSSGNPAGPEFRVNTFTTGVQEDPVVAAAPNGSFMVAWASDPGDVPEQSDVFGRRYDAAGTAQGGEFRVNSYSIHYQQRPQMTSDADGNFVVVWDSWGPEDGNGLAVLGRRYDVSGAAGPAFRLNTYTTGNQEFPSVAADGSGRFVTTWSSPRDGSGRGVAARRYEPDVIFKDGFESTHLGAWSVSSTDGGDLSVSSFAAMKFTTLGLQGVVDDVAALWVQDDSPNDEARYRARFYLDTNGFDPGEALGHRRTRTFIAFSENPTRRVAAIVLRRIGGLYSVSARVRLDDNSQADTAFFPISDGPHVIEISLQRASDADAGNGVLVLFIDNDPVEIFGQLDNSLGEVDFVRLGTLTVKGGANGTLYWDEFESRRQSEIGP